MLLFVHDLHTSLSLYSDGPRFRTRPRSVQADNGATVALSCDVDGNPTPDIIWIYEESQKVLYVSSFIPQTIVRN